MAFKPKIILVGGCFDILHFGHISFLKKAKALGGKLIVALESDVNVRKLKGPGRPIHTQEKRRQMLLALKCVDQVIPLPPLNSDADYARLVAKIKPDLIAVTAGDKKKTHGVKTVVIPKIKTPSTTQITRLKRLL